MLTGDASLPRSLVLDYAGAPLSPQDRAMLDYAVRLSRDPSSIREAHVQALRDAGFSDRAVLDVCQITCYFAYANRLADGLGVELEPGWQEGDLVVTREELAQARQRGARS